MHEYSHPADTHAYTHKHAQTNTHTNTFLINLPIHFSGRIIVLILNLICIKLVRHFLCVAVSESNLKEGSEQMIKLIAK